MPAQPSPTPSRCHVRLANISKGGRLIEPVMMRQEQYQSMNGSGVNLVLFGTAADNLDLVGVDGGVFHLKGDVLDEEGPDLVAEAVGVEVSLWLC